MSDPNAPSGTPSPTLQASTKQAAPTSRFGRLARLTALIPKALPVAMEGAKRALKVERTEEQERQARQRAYEDAKKAGRALVKTLGEMKGLPLKIGQMLSYIDGLAPPGYEEKVQRLLRQLQDKAPPLSAEAAEKVVKADFGVRPQELFLRWERDPFAAASLGQVHRAVTRTGDQVAVKVQYPGIDRALINDLKSLSMLEAIVAPLSRQYQSKETLEEIKRVFLAELDYGREAQNADLFRKITSNLPQVIVPHVYHSLSCRRVLTAQYMDGATYQQFCASASQSERNAAGLTVWSFMFQSLLRYGVMYADPHPGNYRFLGQGKVAFLDFGCVKVLPPEMVAGLKRLMVAAMDSNWTEFDQSCVEFLGLDPTDSGCWDLYRSHILSLLMPFTSSRPYQWTPEGAREAVQFLVRGHRNLLKESTGGPRLPAPIRVPFDLTFVNRLQWGLASILGGLGAEAHFREISEPWVRDGLWPAQQ